MNFLFKKWFQNVKMSGVCTTRDIHTKLPYTIINYSRGKDTTLVTSGKKDTKTINYLDNDFFKLKNNEVKKIFIASKRLIKLFKNESI